MMECLERLRCLEESEAGSLDEMAEVFDKLNELCGGGAGNANAAIATKNGGVELACSLCSKIITRSPNGGSHVPLLSALNATASLLHGQILALLLSLFLSFSNSSIYIVNRHFSQGSNIKIKGCKGNMKLVNRCLLNQAYVLEVQGGLF